MEGVVGVGVEEPTEKISLEHSNAFCVGCTNFVVFGAERIRRW